MKFINHFESCLMYQNHELIQAFVHGIIECEERAKAFKDNMESNDFDVGNVFSSFVKTHT